jgi:hypothetical protein
MKESSEAIDQANFRSIYGCLFFGVPNQGMDISSLIPMVENQVNLNFLTTLGNESQYLRQLHRDFVKSFEFRDSHVRSFYETDTSRTARKASKHTVYAPMTSLVNTYIGTGWEMDNDGRSQDISWKRFGYK